MADDRPGGEPTEEPTPRRLHRARAEGHIAHSADFTSAVGFVAASFALTAGAALLAAELTGIVRAGLERAVAGDATGAVQGAPLGTLLEDVARLSAPIVGAGFVAAAIAGYLQSGGLFTLHPLRPRGDRLNPLAGLRRIASRDAFARLTRALVKAGVIGAVAGWTLVPHLGELPRLVGVRATLAASWTWQLVAQLLVRVAIAYVVVGAADYLWARRKWLARLRMTREEVRREHKEHEGDPQLEMERQRLRRELLRQRMIDSVRTADCVIVSPGQLAVALRYEPARMGAPELVARGEDLVAEQIREVARRHGVLVHADVALARALHRLELGDEIPEPLYDAVAEVLRSIQAER